VVVQCEIHFLPYQIFDRMNITSLFSISNARKKPPAYIIASVKRCKDIKKNDRNSWIAIDKFIKTSLSLETSILPI